MKAVIVAEAPADLDAAAQRLTFFSSLRESDGLQYAALLEHCTLHIVAAGDGVLQQGQSGERVYFIVTGSVEVSAAGRYLATLPAGDSFGEMAMLTGQERTANVKASPGNSAATVLLSIDTKVFGELKDFSQVSLRTKVFFYRLLVQRANWRLEKHRIQYPRHPFFARLPLFPKIAANDEDVELQELHDCAVALTHVLIEWNTLGLEMVRNA